MCFGRSRENKTFTSQQTGAYNQTSNTSQAQTNLSNLLTQYLGQRFGTQTQTFNMLSRSLGSAIAPGPGSYTAGQGGAPAPGGGGGGGGGGRPREEGMGGGVAGVPDFSAQASKFGFDPTQYTTDYDPQRFWANEEAALRTEATELNRDAFSDANQALANRSMQLEGMAPGIEAGATSDLLAAQAEGESRGQLDVSKFGAQQLGEGMKYLAQLKAQLQMAMAEGKLSASQAAAQYKLGQDQIAAQLKAAKAAAGAARGIASAQLAQQDRQFAAQLAQDRYFRGIGALSGLGAMQDPLGYGQTAGSILSGQGSMWGNIYNTGSQGMQASSRSSLWGNILGSALGGIGGIFTGGFGFGSQPGGAAKPSY